MFSGKNYLFTYICFYFYDSLKICWHIDLILVSLEVGRISEDEGERKNMRPKVKADFMEWVGGEILGKEAEEESSEGLEENQDLAVTESKTWGKQGVAKNRKCSQKVKENTDYFNEQMIICDFKIILVQGEDGNVTAEY